MQPKSRHPSMLTKEEHQPSIEATKRDPEVQKDQK
jgi:hypothetical protein